MARRIGAWAALLLGAALAACGGSGGGPAGDAGVWANRVIDYAPVNVKGAQPGDWPYFFAPNAALGPVGGTLDVASLGYDPAATKSTGGSITLGLGAAGDAASRMCAVDGAGADLAVYENAFPTTDIKQGAGVDVEVAVVEVSQDAKTWYAFPHAVLVNNSVHPSDYSGFAGVTPTAQGGDRFDLADVIDANKGALDGSFTACYVRLTDGGMLYPDYGNTQTDLFASGADIDAVQALNYAAAPGLAP
jgi:hypothetical protein